jgi:hypothetical protein
MNTSLKVILTAIGIAVLASPVMAQSESNTHPAASISNARGSVANGRTIRVGRETSSELNQYRLDDCVHVAFPQCGGDKTQSQFDR